MRALGVLVGLALVVTGCSTVDSADIRTSGMTADLLVKLPENAVAVDVTASFRVSIFRRGDLMPPRQRS